MPQRITNDMSCQIWSLFYQYIFICSSITPDNRELEQIINVNPFYWLMIFVCNIYSFYITQKGIDISIKIPSKKYDWYKFNKRETINIRRQFLHITQNITDQTQKTKYLRILIDNGYQNLIKLILDYHHIEETKFIKTLTTLYDALTDVQKSYFKEKIREKIGILRGKIDLNQNYPDRQTYKSQFDSELIKFKTKLKILEKFK